MCFSASASFTAAAVLIPLGAVCVNKSIKLDRPYWATALLPLVFGIQQVFEGSVWLGLGASVELPRTSALGFMFFSHLFWLFWVPFACYLVESNPFKRKLFIVFTLLGLAHGLLMYVPLLINSQWLAVEIVQHSISYQAILLYDDVIPRLMVRVIYALIILLPLLMSTQSYIRWFGGIIALSIAFTVIFFGYAFISVWCFFAAILSIYIFYMISRLQVKTTQAL